MNLELSSLRLLVGAAFAVSITGACGTIHNIGDNPNGTGGNSPVATGGAGNGGSVSTGGAGGIGGAMQTGGAQNGTGGTACNIPCPASYMSISLVVTAATDGGVMSGVEVTVSGPATGTMLCQPYDGVTTVCRWPFYTVTEGSYSLLVTAPGFQAVNVSATLAITHGSCCEPGSLEPSTVTLDTCTGTDCSVPVTCVRNGQTYAVGSFYSEGCTSCMCQPDGTWGHCTGACLSSGGASSTGGGASTGGSGPGGANGNGGTGTGGTDNGTGGTTCTGAPPGNCVCLPDGTWGHCLGANLDPLVKSCVDSGGTAMSGLCCTSPGTDFPNTCSIGACSCSPENSTTISICECPSGTCFDGTACVSSNTPEQSNCYSPTQNIDIALSPGAEGCSCDAANAATNCVQDSSAHTLMLTCELGKWQAVAGGTCM